MTVAERFWAKVLKGEGCWEWQGSKSKAGGYGYVHVGGQVNRRPMKAHRLSWELHNGPIPHGLWVLHQCDNPPCVNPSHLFLGTRTDNMQNAASKGRIKTVGQSRIAHCKRGHDFTPENTKRRANGHRRCVACDASAYLVKKAKRQLAAAIRKDET